ncbi:MAG TPA: hypothetical protein VLK27_06015 [Chthoniobacterales bacterium]|nr:hypothetical protein [Chthoniobacterales bacterium]
MSRIIEAIIWRLAEPKRVVLATQPKRLVANWQNGLESGGHVQRKLRLGFTSVPVQESGN